MARPRLAAGTSFIRTPSMKRSPTVIASSPAISRSKVDLPHPEGPTRTTNSRSFTSRSMLLSTSTWAKRLPRPRALSSLMTGASLHGPLRQAADELPLEGEEGDEDRMTEFISPAQHPCRAATSRPSSDRVMGLHAARRQWCDAAGDLGHPILVTFLALQRQFIGGLTQGAVK